MATAAGDFKIIWDNAYAVHDFTPGQPSAPDIAALCEQAGHGDRPLLFASTSKMLIPSAGLAFFGASPTMVNWWLGCRKFKTIGPDKVNQVRHLLFFKNSDGLQGHMRQHGDLLRDKFAAVDSILHKHLAGLDQVRWSTPAGGYFIALEVPSGLAKHVVALAEQANVKMTPAGATHCYGVDIHERCLRIAPSYLSLEEVKAATEVIALAVLLAMGQAEARVEVTP
jgi:DNA-binding transcriptional MocR family regulator